MDNAGVCFMPVRGDRGGAGAAAQLDTGDSRMLTRIAAAVFAAFMLMPLAASAQGTQGLDPENTIYMDLPAGRVVIKLLPKVAPLTVARIKKLTRMGFYDGTPFHRVIPGFMAQGGDPTGTGNGGSDLPNLKAEFSNVPFKRGTVGMARLQGDPNSANSQFFICFADAPWLNGQYTVWGQVVSGMEYVDKLKKGVGRSGIVQNPDHIIKMQVAADVKK
jgi:peptidylprolyl isomerase